MVAQRIKLMAPIVTYIFTRWPFIKILSVAVKTYSCSVIPTTVTRRRRSRTSDALRTRRWKPSRTRIPGSASSKNTLCWTLTAGRLVGPRTASRARRAPITAASAPIRCSVASSSTLTIKLASMLAWRSQEPMPRWCPRNGNSR